MTETHELRLKIDAGAAESGAKRFMGAVDAVQKAVHTLDRDTSGAFSSLRKVDTSGMREVIRETKQAAKEQQQFGNASDRAVERIRALAVQSAKARPLAEEFDGEGVTHDTAKFVITADKLPGIAPKAQDNLRTEDGLLWSSTKVGGVPCESLYVLYAEQTTRAILILKPPNRCQSHRTRIRRPCACREHTKCISCRWTI